MKNLKTTVYDYTYLPEVSSPIHQASSSYYQFLGDPWSIRRYVLLGIVTSKPVHFRGFLEEGYQLYQMNESARKNKYLRKEIVQALT